MSHSPDEVKRCTHFGHIYASLLVMRCPHTEGWFATAQSWADTDGDDTQHLYASNLTFGPFDTAAEIEQAVHHLADRALAASRAFKV